MSSGIPGQPGQEPAAPPVAFASAGVFPFLQTALSWWRLAPPMPVVRAGDACCVVPAAHRSRPSGIGRTGLTDRRYLPPAPGPPREASTWLNATEVADGGHSAEVLLSRYAKCIDGRQEVANRRIEDLLRAYE